MTDKQELPVPEDLWTVLAGNKKTVVLYGMGNGADKILRACSEKGIPVAEVFASDGFARGNLFHGMTVKTWAEVRERYGVKNLTVLLSFATSRPEVLKNIRRIASEAELYAPDVPVFGDGLFDTDYFRLHRAELRETETLLTDVPSQRMLRNLVCFKLTGNLGYLEAAGENRLECLRAALSECKPETALDIGAYNGDTVRELLELSGDTLQTVYAMEPDARNFRKLKTYADRETRAAVIPLPFAAWSVDEELTFDGSGNRNAAVGENRSQTLCDRPASVVAVSARTVDSVLNGARVDFLKIDAEGSEREVLLGSVETVRRWKPLLWVSLYHRNGDLFELPLLIRRLFPCYRRFTLSRPEGIPAWDVALCCQP